MSTPTIEPKQAMRDRLTAAAERVEATRALHRTALRERDVLIFEAIDAVGLSHRDCARAAHIALGRLEQILAGV